MLTAEQRHWCLDQAIEIVKHAPTDSLATHDRLKRVYKRLLALMEQVEHGEITKPSKNAKTVVIKKN